MPPLLARTVPFLDRPSFGRQHRSSASATVTSLDPIGARRYHLDGLRLQKRHRTPNSESTAISLTAQTRQAQRSPSCTLHPCERRPGACAAEREVVPSSRGRDQPPRPETARPPRRGRRASSRSDRAPVVSNNIGVRSDNVEPGDRAGSNAVFVSSRLRTSQLVLADFGIDPWSVDEQVVERTIRIDGCDRRRPEHAAGWTTSKNVIATLTWLETRWAPIILGCRGLSRTDNIDAWARAADASS